MSIASSQSRFEQLNVDPALAEEVAAAPDQKVIEGIIRLEDPNQIPSHFTVVSQFKSICTGRFAAAHTWTIRRHPNVVSLKAARPLGNVDDDGNLADLVPPKETRMTGSSSAPFAGRGCVVAALDFGLDFAHPNFLNPDGTTRLVGFWHQGALYDPARPNRFGYGRFYSPQEVNTALRTSDPYQALGYHPATSDTGNGSHGTHTLDIAAGNGRAGGAHASAASSAGLIFVHLSTPRLGEVGDLGDSVRVLEALDAVNTMARGRPWAVNLSVGRTAGCHDGTSLVEQGMQELLRSGEGRAICQSCGNYRSANLAVEGRLRDGKHRDLQWIIDPADTTANEMDVWYSGRDRFVVGIRPPQGSAFIEVKLGEVADIAQEGTVFGRIYHRKDDPNNRDNHAEIFLYPGAPPGVWTVRLSGDYVISGRFHAWIERDLARPGAQSRFDPKITSQSYTLGTIATSPLVITVGAYDANAAGRPLAPFSSCGPTRDERRDKPELLAPGVEVVAARSIPRGAVRQEGLLVARSGTSMAAPHVTGTVAAMFEAAGRPVSIDEIRDCLRRSAEPAADADPANCCAWGRLNTAEAIRTIRVDTESDRRPALRAHPLARDAPVDSFERAIFDDEESGAFDEEDTEASLDEGVLSRMDEIDNESDDAPEPFEDETLWAAHAAGDVEIIDVDEGATQIPGILVVDEHGQPLVDGEYSIYQGERSEHGSFPKGGNGFAPFKTIDVAQPFMFEVRDRVCAIRAGAFIDPDDPAIEYGGTWFDWTLVRDNNEPDKNFWPYYQREMDFAAKAESYEFGQGRRIDRFLQHEHITRRSIRVARPGQPGEVRLVATPASVRVGPLVRYTDHERAVIWLETVTPAMVRVRCKDQTGSHGSLHHASTVRVGGRHFAAVEIVSLEKETLYKYTVELAPLPASGAIPTSKNIAGVFPDLTPPVAGAIKKQLAPASLDETEWLTFRTLRPKFDNQLRFATGSCRWYPGDKKNGKDWGPDMLDGLGRWLLLNRNHKERWPHFLFFGGDQIYADEIGDDHGEMLIQGRFAARIPGPVDPAGPVRDNFIGGAWAGRFAHRYKSYNDPDIKLVKRVKDDLEELDELYRKYPEIKGLYHRYPKTGTTDKESRVLAYQLMSGLTWTLGGKVTDDKTYSKARDLLQTVDRLNLRSGSFRYFLPHWATGFSTALRRNPMANRYLSHNFLLWEIPNFEPLLPTVVDSSNMAFVQPNHRGHLAPAAGRHAADFAEYAYLHERSWTSSRSVRRLLAQIPTFLMFDDHEVTDDWNFDLSWVRMLHNEKDDFRMWPKTLTDGLAAYWVYQGWCNKAPSQWSGNDPRIKALADAQRTGRDALPELRRCIYRACFMQVPSKDPRVPKATFQTGLSLDWHYKLPFDPPFLVPDCRTRKLMTAADDDLRIIDHDDPKKRPMSQTIDDAQLDWMRQILVKRDGPVVAFIAPSTPLLMQKKVMDIMMKPETTAEAWDQTNLPSLVAAASGSTTLGTASDALLRVFRKTKDLEHMIRDKSWRDLWGLVDAICRAGSRLKTLVLVSGDVHHSYCMTANLHGSGRPKPELLQITCSGLQTTIRSPEGRRLADALGDSSFGVGKYRLVPGFMFKNNERVPELSLYENAAAFVEVTLGSEVNVRVRYLSGDDEHVYLYTSSTAYMRDGEPTDSPWQKGRPRLFMRETEQGESHATWTGGHRSAEGTDGLFDVAEDDAALQWMGEDDASLGTGLASSSRGNGKGWSPGGLGLIGSRYRKGAAMDRNLDQAERALRAVRGGRRQSEVSFLQALLRDTGADVATVGMSPAALFRALLDERPSTLSVRDVLEVLAMPSQRPDSPLRSGDLMLRAVPGTGDIGHVAVLASDELLEQPILASEAIDAESVQPGQYGLVIEAGAFPHSRSRPFARRWLDSSGRVPPHTVLLRPRYSDLEARVDFPPDEDAYGSVSSATGSPSADVERAGDFAGADYGDIEQPIEHQFDLSALPPDVADAIGKRDWPLAVKLAIRAGSRDENQLTNLIFFAQHPELPATKLDPNDPNFERLSGEWSKIQDGEVWSAIRASAENTDLIVSGEEVTDHHRRFFRGERGKRLAALVEHAAREVDLNPGLLGTIMMAETRRPQSYLSSEKASSYHIGVDDFFEARAAIRARVPTYARVKWDKKQKPSEHLNDARTNPRVVKTILFDSGPDAVLATAVYVKFGEVRLREVSAKLGGDFDSLPLATRMSLTRMAMAAGTGGATRFLKNALKGGDIFVRKAIPVKAYQTQRNGTVRTAQAMHLSDWVFGIPVPAAVAQPEAFEVIADFDTASEQQLGPGRVTVRNRVFQVGDVVLNRRASEDVRRNGNLLPSQDQSHILVRGSGQLGYEVNYAAPQDPFRWNLLKSIIDNEHLDIYAIDSNTMFLTHDVTISQGTATTVPRRISLAAFLAGGITLHTLLRQRAIAPSEPRYVTSTSAARHQIYYDSTNGGRGLLGSNSLAHELFGHFSLGMRGAPWRHPRSIVAPSATAHTIPASAGITDPFNQPFEGPVDDYIFGFAGAETGPFESPTLFVNSAFLNQVLVDLGAHGARGLTRSGMNWGSSDEFNRIWLILSQNYRALGYTRLPPGVRGAPTKLQIERAVTNWFAQLTTEQQWIFHQYLFEAAARRHNRPTQLAQAMLTALQSPPHPMPPTALPPPVTVQPKAGVARPNGTLTPRPHAGTARPFEYEPEMSDFDTASKQQCGAEFGKDRTGFARTLDLGRTIDRARFGDDLIAPQDREIERETEEVPQAASCRKRWESFIASLPEDVRTALAANDFDVAVTAAVHLGLRDVNKLTDMLFLQNWGQTRGYCQISLNERDPAGKKMADWWIELRQKHVVPALNEPSPKLPQAGGIVCIERAVCRAKAVPESTAIDLTGTYEQQRPGKAPREIVRINQAGTHIECLFRRVSKSSDTAPGQTAFLFGDRQEDGSYYLFSARNPRTQVLLKPAGGDIVLKAGGGQSTLQSINDDAAHLLPTLGNYVDELVRLREQRPISHAQFNHLVEGLAPKNIEPYLTEYFRQSPDDLVAARSARRRSGDRFDVYLKSVFRHPELGFLNIDKQDVQLVSFYARSLLSEAKWKNGDIMSHLDWIQRMQSRMVRDDSSLIYAEEWLGIRRLPGPSEPKHRYKVEIDLKGGGFWIHGYRGTITFEKISDDTPNTRWKKGERHSYGCRIVGGQAGASLGFQQTGEAITDYEWQPRDIPGPIRVGQLGVSASYGPASAGATGGFIHVEGSRQFPLMHVTFEDFDFDVDPKKLKKRRRGKPTAKSLKIGPGGFFGSIRPKTFPPQDLSTPPERTDYAVVLSLQEDVHFCLDSALLTEDARQALRIMIAKELPAFESPLSRIEITGHTDRSVPPSLKPAEKVRYNQVLSELRAQNTWQTIVDILGSGLAIPPDEDHRLIVGQGDSLAAKAGQRPGQINPVYRRVDVVLNARLVLTLRGQ